MKKPYVQKNYINNRKTSVQKGAKYKKNDELSYCFGAYPVIELLGAREECVTRIFIRSNSDKNSGVQKIKQICEKKGIRVTVSDGFIYRASGKENVYAMAEFAKYKSVVDYDENTLVLSRPSDRGNLGTIIRTMLAFNFNNLVLIEPAVDVFHPELIRASMGALFKINFEYFPSFQDYANKTKNKMYMFVTNKSSFLKNIKYEAPYSLVFGNEADGLDNNFMKYGIPVKIDQGDEVDSLNLSVSVAIGLYHSKLQ